MIFEKKFINISVTTLFLLSTLPIFVGAQSQGGGNQPAQNDGTGITYECNPLGECTFYDLVAAVLKVITWARNFATAFSVVVIAYAGFLYMNSGGSPGGRSKANGMLVKVVIGLTFIWGAWLIVKLILDGLNVNSSINTFIK